jgi:ubiquinone/menaquinone biosynthesis C-methylase UbiE
VLSSFVVHLGEGQREKTSREVRRVLAPGGSFHVLDFVRPAEGSAGWWDRLVFSSPHFKDNSDSRILAVLSQGGFASAKKVKDAAIFFGLLHVSYYKASVAPTDHEGGS